MDILGEKFGIIEKRSLGILSAVVLPTFLLLLLYHKDVWRPIQYWLLLNGSILFIIPLLSLSFFTEKKNPRVQIIAALFIVAIICSIFLVSIHKPLFSSVKQLNTVLAIAAVMISITVLLLILGKVDIRKFGIHPGRVKLWLPITVVFFICMVPILYWASLMPEFQKTYPMLPLAKKGVMGFIVAELSFGLFFIFWEYFFRGYMLFVLEKRTGFLIANLVQAMAFAFMHLGKPELEVYSSLVGGLIIGWLCYRSRSFLPAFLIHWGIQTTMDLFAVTQ
jgi:membrane protease YdiL (CAAX protease family)